MGSPQTVVVHPAPHVRGPVHPPGDKSISHRYALFAALADGTLDRDRLVQAAGRVIALQRWQEQLAQASGPVDDEDVGSGAMASQELSAAAITLVAGPCEGPWLGQSVSVRGHTEADVAAPAEDGEGEAEGAPA